MGEVLECEDPKKSSKIILGEQSGQLGEALELSEKEKKQLAAVKQNGYAIKYIENPSEEVQLAAVKQNWEAIKYIENPSEEAIKYVKSYLN